jgi:hypothetical protein
MRDDARVILAKALGRAARVCASFYQADEILRPLVDRGERFG